MSWGHLEATTASEATFSKTSANPPPSISEDAKIEGGGLPNFCILLQIHLFFMTIMWWHLVVTYAIIWCPDQSIASLYLKAAGYEGIPL